MSAHLTFHGGVGTVTGANFLLDTQSAKILVDCGTRELEHTCDTINFEPFPYDVREIDALLVTHAHADHIGRIPKLVRDGFRGTIYSTRATKDLAAVMFSDALHIMQDHAVKFGCATLYEKEDVEAALSIWSGHEYHEPFAVKDVGIELLDAGHILGSSLVKFSRGERSVVFTGDLGNTPEPLLNDTESPDGANYIVMESVYGDRLHEGREERKEHLRQAIETVRSQKGTLLIPSFSLERTQVLLFELNDMIESGKMTSIPVYLDAPLATRVTEVFRTYSSLFNPVAEAHFARGDDPFAFNGLKVIHNATSSHSIHTEADPKVIIAGAGMSAGGRIRDHEKYYLGNAHATIMFVGYQAPGTLGRRIQDGEKKVKIDNEFIRVHAHIETLSGYSGHADRDQLLEFIENAGASLEKVFVTMGEPKASAFLAQRAKDFLGVDAIVPEKGKTFEINF